MKKMFFMSGLQRAGSTLLGSLISQNPDFYVSPTSPLLDYLCMSDGNISQLCHNYTFDNSKVNKEMSRLAFEGFYNHIEKDYIIDKHRGWTKNVNSVKKMWDDNPKVIATYRPISENVCSFIKLAEKDKDNSLDAEIRKKNLSINNRNRAIYIWENWTAEIYSSLKYGLDNHREDIYVVHYKNLVNNTKEELNSIYDFFDVERYNGHYFENIQNTLSEQRDEVWGFKGLHDIRTNKIEYKSYNPEDILDKDLIDEFARLDNELNV